MGRMDGKVEPIADAHTILPRLITLRLVGAQRLPAGA
jgi:hypothetical protein